MMGLCAGILCAVINSVYLFHSVTNNVIPNGLGELLLLLTDRRCKSKAVCDTGCFKKMKGM